MKLKLFVSAVILFLSVACTATTATPVDNRSLAETVGIPAGECVFYCP